MFYSENKLYDRKESSLTKYYCVRSKLTVSENFLRSPLSCETQFVMFLTILLKNLSHWNENSVCHLNDWLSTLNITDHSGKSVYPK